MTATAAYLPGHFRWADLATTDPIAAKAFYAGMFGWEFEDRPAGPDMFYTLCRFEGQRVAGLFSPQCAQPGGSYWKSYVTVANVDECAARAVALGGQVPMPPMDVLDAGRMAMIQDPSGAVLAVWEPRADHGAEWLNQPGGLCWNELQTHDCAAAAAFYMALFGWEAEVPAVVPGGYEYTCFATGGALGAGMLAIQPAWGEVPPNWSVYFAVADCDASAARALELGGSVCLPPIDIADVGRLAVLRDPQGGVFSVIQPDPACQAG